MIGWVQRTSDAIPHHAAFKDTTDSQHVAGLHLQTAWQHQLGDNGGLRLFALLHARPPLQRSGRAGRDRRRSNRRRPDADAARSRHRHRSNLVARRAPQPHRRRRTTCSAASISTAARRACSRCSADASASCSTACPPASGTSPIRCSRPTGASDRLPRSSATASRCRRASPWTAGCGSKRIGGSAAGQDGTISWLGLLPRAGFHWTMLNFWELGAFGSYGRYGHRLPLNDLAYGDPPRRPPTSTAGTRRFRGLPQQKRHRPARPAARSRHRRRRRLLVDRSGAEAAVPGRGGARLRRAAEPADVPPHRRDRPARDDTWSASPTSACRNRPTPRSPCRTWASTSSAPATISC